MKYVFFDMDGTLWDEELIIPESTKAAIRELRENGHKTFICTGRSRGNINSDELLGMGFDGIVAACGNHIEMDGRVIYENVLDGDTIKHVLETLKKYRMPVVVEGPEYHWFDRTGFERDPFILYLIGILGDKAKYLDGYEPGMRVNKFSADVWEDTDYPAIRREIGDKFDFIEHDSVIVEIIPKGSSKATGIDWLCKHMGISIEDTYAVGDSANDLDMLRFVGHSICMGNGSKPAKEAAEYVTDDIHEDGIYNAMKHYGLI